MIYRCEETCIILYYAINTLLQSVHCLVSLFMKQILCFISCFFLFSSFLSLNEENKTKINASQQLVRHAMKKTQLSLQLSAPFKILLAMSFFFIYVLFHDLSHRSLSDYHHLPLLLFQVHGDIGTRPYYRALNVRFSFSHSSLSVQWLQVPAQSLPLKREKKNIYFSCLTFLFFVQLLISYFIFVFYLPL